MIKITFIVLLLVASSKLVDAQKAPERIDCDLTYKSILEQNKLSEIDWIKRWFTTYNKSPARSWILQWKGDPIVSFVLIEHPAFHAAERTTLWLVRTKSHAYYWESVQKNWYSEKQVAEHTQKKEINSEAYDKFLETSSSWKQAKILKPKAPIDGFSPEFWGFLTILTKDSCRQILLGLDDFMSCSSTECEPGSKHLRSGRVMEALSLIFSEN